MCAPIAAVIQPGLPAHPGAAFHTDITQHDVRVWQVSILKTVILLAGHATRMRPLTDYLNKGMVPIAGKPLAEYVVQRLVAVGLTDLIIAVTKFPEQLQAHFGDGRQFGANIEYLHRPQPSGTAGEVYAARERIPRHESFLVHYGDILTNFDLAAMLAQHQQTQPLATIGLVTDIHIHAGVAEVDEDGYVTHFQEKPPVARPCHAAIDVLGPGIWDYLGPDMDFGINVFPALLRAREHVRGFIDQSAWWLDVGRLSDLDDAAELLSRS